MSLTYAEVLNQPASWKAALGHVPPVWAGIAQSLDIDAISHALFMGSGTSLYIAQAAAQSFMEITGTTATAVPTSEVFLSSATTVPRSGSVLAFVISRSGTTSEALLAADFLRTTHSHVKTIGITCNAGTGMAARCDACIELSFATEKSVVMTQSFTTMLLTLQIVASLIASNDAMLENLARLPDAFGDQLADVDRLAQRLGWSPVFDKTIYLGLGPNQGLAEEGTLKLKEMTQSACEAYNPLEFRHGPISIVDERTLIVLFEGRRERAYIADVERDLKRHGAHVVAVGPYPSTGADDSLVVGATSSDLARCLLYLPFAQLLAYYRALSLGLDPDKPRNLSSVVVLNVR
ncbi:MAG: SIS domain-containing protein [Chloroflexia bacterium]|nr:SIS domain-containing protein [Chloroflexia bacterium]